MIGAYASVALIVGASLAVGQAILALCARRDFSWLSGPVGLAALVAISGIAIKLPGHQTAAEVALVVAVAVALLILGRAKQPFSDLGIPLFAGALALLLASLPFIAAGQVGILGVGLVNDDMAYHLLMANWVGSHSGVVPPLIHQGYPVGPHSLVDALSGLIGTSLVNAFAGLTLAIPVLTALAAAGALRRVRPGARVAVGALVSVSYLGAAYLAQEAFKEPMEALFLLSVALWLPTVKTVRDGIPLGVLGAGAIYAYSFPGLFWLVGAVGIYVALTQGVRPLDRGWLRFLVPFALAAGLVVVAALPEISRLIDFSHFKAFSPATANSGGLGNLRHHLSPLEAFGVWPTSEFRLAAGDSAHPIAYYAGGLLALAAFAVGVPRWVRRHGPALPAAIAAAALIYLVARVSGTVYTSAKALSIISPLILLAGLGGLAREEGEERRLPLLGLALAFGVAALACSVLVLRQAPVGPTTHHDELASFTSEIDGQKVLFLGRDDFVLYDLLGARPYVTVHNYYDNFYAKPNLKLKSVFEKFDFDTVTPKTLAEFPFVITTSGKYSSAPPSWLHPVTTTPDFVLWKRAGSVSLDRHVLDEGAAPGAVYSCRRGLSGTAQVFPGKPVTASEWSGGPTLESGSSASQTLRLTPGRWDVSLQYDATRPVFLRGSGFAAELPANLDYRGTTPFYAAGSVRVRKGGAFTVSASVEQPPLAGRLLGANAVAHLGTIAFTPAGPHSGIDLSHACGQYVDWYSRR